MKQAMDMERAAVIIMGRTRNRVYPHIIGKRKDTPISWVLSFFLRRLAEYYNLRKNA